MISFQQPKFSTCGLDTEEVTGGYYGVHHNTIRKMLKEVFKDVEITDWDYDFDCLSRNVAFKTLHRPYNKPLCNLALYRLKFDELFLMQLAMLKKRRQRGNKVPFLWQFNFTQHKQVMDYFPYEFTTEQKNVVRQITHDITARQPMSRLLHGEVGSGKTAVAFYAAMLTALNNKRTLILCPTTILAQQHYDTLRGMGWGDLGLYSSGSYISFNPTHSGDEKSASIIIGTHALLNNKPLLKSASLVIVDEFQKFGVDQRATLQKYGNPHTLLMSATPIPRTLAMSVFGDLDISMIQELPIKRGTVVTKCVLPDKREQMYEIIDGELVKGKQVYVVYPRIGDDEQEQSARSGYRQISQRFEGAQVGFLVGSMRADEKAGILRRFKGGQTQILVSTIIAEVGLDNPNASVMVIEGADRFGLSQLHQLRGRVCRSTDTTFCFMVSDTANEESIARLDVMEKCNDGFEIAEHDLRLRGMGELFSTRQHGLPDLKFASLVDDYGLLVKARELASEYIGKLDNPECAGLKEMLEIKYNNTIRFGGTA